MRKWHLWAGAICLSAGVVAIYMSRAGSSCPTELDAAKLIAERGGEYHPVMQSEWPITEVRRGGARLSDADLPTLRGLKHLKRLNLEGTQVTDAGLKELKDFKELTSLNLSGTRVTDCGLRALADLRRLNYLKPPRVNDATLHILAELDLLYALATPADAPEDYQGRRPANASEVCSLNLMFASGVTDDGIKAIRKLPNLTILNLGGTGVSDNGMQEIGHLTALRELHLYSTRVSAEGLRALRDLTQLTTLFPPEHRITDESLGALIQVGLLHTVPKFRPSWDWEPAPSTKDIRSLTLRDTLVTDAGLWRLDSLPRLVDLDLGRTHVTDRGLREFIVRYQLESLDLSQTAITDAGMMEIKQLKKLKELNLAGTQVTDASLSMLQGLTQLNELGVNESVVTDRSLKSLADAGLVHALWLADQDKRRPKNDAEVGSLTLYNTQVTDAGLKELKHLKQLKELRLREWAVTDAALETLFEIGLLHALDRAEAEGGKRPKNAAEVRLFRLANCYRVTPAGRRFLQEVFPNCELRE